MSGLLLLAEHHNQRQHAPGVLLHRKPSCCPIRLHGTQQPSAQRKHIFSKAPEARNRQVIETFPSTCRLPVRNRVFPQLAPKLVLRANNMEHGNRKINTFIRLFRLILEFMSDCRKSQVYFVTFAPKSARRFVTVKKPKHSVCNFNYTANCCDMHYQMLILRKIM